MSEPSIHEANKMLRVLNGQRLKYTVRVHHPDGKVTEFQSESNPTVKWDDGLREPWLFKGYSEHIMRWPDGAMLLVEENPKT